MNSRPLTRAAVHFSIITQNKRQRGRAAACCIHALVGMWIHARLWATVTSRFSFTQADRTCGLHRIRVAVAEAGVNVEYMYTFVRQSGRNAVMIFRCDDTAKAESVLRTRRVWVTEEKNRYAMRAASSRGKRQRPPTTRRRPLLALL